jgi:hypothetical protein
MLSDELRNLSIWLRERLEANTRLTGEELAEQLSIEGLPR